MNTKEAIEFIRNQKYSINEFKNRYYLSAEIYRKDCNRTFDKIIELLQRGEKFEAMWEEFSSLYGFNTTDINENKMGIFGSKVVEYRTIHTLMGYLEQKYFPKGENRKGDD